MSDTSTVRPGFLQRTKVRLQTAGQLLGALGRSPFWWLIPFCVILVILSAFLVIANLFPTAAPFLYALF